jgi:hypothetical protein
MDWNEQEQRTIAHIMAAETMHDPANQSGERRIQCSRIEAIRRMRRRTNSAGIYREPSRKVLAWVTERPKVRTDKQRAILAAHRKRSATTPEVAA